MGRSKEVEKTKVEYKRIGGGSSRLILGGRKKIAKPNERFWAFPEDIPEAFKDVIMPVNEEAGVKVNIPSVKKVKKVYKVKVRPKTDGDPDPGKTKKGNVRKWYDVVNKDNDTAMNPTPLTEGKAKLMATGLNAG